MPFERQPPDTLEGILALARTALADLNDAMKAANSAGNYHIPGLKRIATDYDLQGTLIAGHGSAKRAVRLLEKLVQDEKNGVPATKKEAKARSKEQKKP